MVQAPLLAKGWNIRPPGKAGLMFPTYVFFLPAAIPRFIIPLGLDEVGHTLGVDVRITMTGEA